MHTNMGDNHPDRRVEEVSNNIITLVCFFIMMQNTLKIGLSMFSKLREIVVQKELMQLHFLDTFKPIKMEVHTKEEHVKSIGKLISSEEKQNGTIKRMNMH